jgi:hypothetical protein
MKGIFGMAAVMAVTIMMIGGVSVLAAEKTEKALPERGTWEFEEALQAGSLPPEVFRGERTPGIGVKGTAEEVRILDRIYRVGVDTP